MNALQYIAATVEPSNGRWLAGFQRTEDYLVKTFGKPHGIEHDTNTVGLQFGIPGVPSKPGGLVASLYVYTTHDDDGVSVNFNVWALGYVLDAEISDDVSRRTDVVIRKLTAAKSLLESKVFKDLVVKVLEPGRPPLTSLTHFGHAHGFNLTSGGGEDVDDAIAEAKANRTALLAWARR